MLHRQYQTNQYVRCFIKSVFICLLAFLIPTQVAAATPDETNQTISIDYNVSETEWVWSIPPDQSFTNDKLTFDGLVKIMPAQDGGLIILNNATKITISLNSKNDFWLSNTYWSSIEYKVRDNNQKLNNGDKVLEFIAGTSDNHGVENTLTFVTTNDDIKMATLAGPHTDIITFTVNVSSTNTTESN